ncbi:cell wall metabolism sensor histidine kinase VicK [Streptococcus dysgalactiae subsp. equisimilis]|uniref:cell wall metabolism sensor histidine kinase VicK n=1 Tax=Streptococcus dysgalactiae TaxID=1334 RepID=UPI000A120F5C|nr:cell wall metabolism sensor histidine kinase VicK [Streptococcus dysgalactiae]MCY7196247.1 cell wall metabolism sensor histidine kinase VicK [Streptococcus dysgalactiae]MCY7200050.1 cell wall metabolism sensor histidine kinase VicK [Streptococcus dysgalactiae]MCY7206804.1 cell wall metabolism sensor histidine kinase VicK [Streptococcus dysgalactiae]MCY7216556.1 cell wall metabolism sensor histidine kinase VicK [Streptococcus dysgalactiae]ORJ91904.1 cell wall metabolism sensor histidine kina
MTRDIIGNLSAFELAILLLLVFVAFYFIHLAVRDYRNARIIRMMSYKIRDLINGRYTDMINEKADIELMELADQLNDLSDVFRLTHENLAQEKNRLASILAYMSDGVLATDRSGKIIMINETARKQLNLTKEKALEKNITDLLEGDTPYTYRELVSKTPVVTVNSRNDMGEFVTLRLRFALNRRESGFISGLVVVLHDTTEQEKEERERRLFVSNVSHELRTPLTSVKSYLEALDEGAIKEDIAPSFIKVSLDETNRMMRMISDLLNLSRIDNQVTQLSVEMTNFTAFMTSILNRFDLVKNQHTGTGKFYEIVRDYPITSVWLEIDNDKMTQVIENILNNAIKYSPDGGKITVRMKTTDTQLIISISDQGLGIPKKDLPLIFDRFYRVDKARSRAQGGTGLGLAIAKEIIKQHHGFIWAKSDYGKGSTFTIVLPYEKDAAIYEEWEDDID